jgi:LmbE family N-acetylglucosaminyl deacetylase
MNRTALAIAAHPDDIEFVMSGTLLRLRDQGWAIHYLNVADGSCGSRETDAATTRRIRRREAQEAARRLGAVFHPGFARDLEITYDPPSLRRLAALVREVRPAIVLTHALADYMEDHMNTARLAVTAAFARGMPNFRTRPPRQAWEGDVAVYHALPHGLRDGLSRPAIAELFVDVTPVQPRRLEALGAHRSQQAWLDVSQGMNSYLQAMEDMARAVGRQSRRFRLAEGWVRHNPLGLGPAGEDPLRTALGTACRRNPSYRAGAAG